MSEEEAQDTRTTSLPAADFLEACTGGYLSRQDAISTTCNQDASTQSLGLKRAAENGHFNVVRYLLETEPAIKVDSLTADSAVRGGLPIYRLLHSEYLDMIHWSFGIMGSAVHIAVRCCNIELLTYILEHGADPGRTPECSRYGYFFTPIEDAALVDSVEAARVLVKYGATFEATEALEIAASFGHLEMTRCLIDLGTDANYIRGLRDPEWDNCQSRCTGPLHSATKNGHYDVVELLLAHGADSQLQDISGMTAKDVALNAGNQSILDLLEKFEE